MSKNTNALRKYGQMIKNDPRLASENSGIFIMLLADEVDRLREGLENAQASMVKAIPFLNQAYQMIDHVNNPENCEI